MRFVLSPAANRTITASEPDDVKAKRKVSSLAIHLPADREGLQDAATAEEMVVITAARNVRCKIG